VRHQDGSLVSQVTVSPAKPAAKANASFGAFSVDAPEFVPSGWVPNASAVERSAGSNADAEGAAESAEQRRRKEDENRRKGPAAAMKAPEFVPSWCQQPEPCEDGAAASTNFTEHFSDFGLAEDDELAVSKAIERMSAQTKEDRSKDGQAKKEKKPQQASNLEVRHYVRQVLSDELDEKVKYMLGELAKFQERTKERDPQKFAKLKRFCVGMSEAARNVKRGKAKCLVLAPNLDRSEADGGLDDTVEDLMDLCFEHEVPVVFALSRNRMGKALGKNIRMSLVCVLSPEGVHQEFKQIIKLTEELRRQWVMRRMALGAQEVLAQSAAADEPVPDPESINERVLRHLEEQRLVEERRRAEEKAKRDAEKAVQKEIKAAERQVKQEERRAQQKAERDTEAAKEAEELKLKEDADAEKKRLAAIKEVARQELVEKARQEKERKAEEERKRIAEQDAKAKAAAGSDSDSDDDDLPAGFNADFF